MSYEGCRPTYSFINLKRQKELSKIKFLDML